LKIF
jgi:hypothetical protein